MRTHQHTSGHHITAPREALGERGEDQIGIGQGIEVDAGADRVIGDHRNAAVAGQGRHAGQVHAAQQRIARQLHDHGRWLELIQRCFHFGEGLRLQQLATVKHHARLLQHIHVGKAQRQRGPTRPEHLDGAEGCMQAGHSRRMQADLLGVDAMDASQARSNHLPCRFAGCAAGGRFFSQGDGCLAGGEAQASVLPERLGMGAGGCIAAQAAQAGVGD